MSKIKSYLPIVLVISLTVSAFIFLCIFTDKYIVTPQQTNTIEISAQNTSACLSELKDHLETISANIINMQYDKKGTYSVRVRVANDQLLNVIPDNQHIVRYNIDTVNSSVSASNLQVEHTLLEERAKEDLSVKDMIKVHEELCEVEVKLDELTHTDVTYVLKQSDTVAYSKGLRTVLTIVFLVFAGVILFLVAYIAIRTILISIWTRKRRDLVKRAVTKLSPYEMKQEDENKDDK